MYYRVEDLAFNDEESTSPTTKVMYREERLLSLLFVERWGHDEKGKENPHT
ncbi:Hypothetical predicted protein [Olea europaea subsp. europaea]|uniref:Uncharacterized protein n=1 Tax=Olea europaea subsp. europaea TaxID=158383 RepID=A0A8S0UPB8_OLEEU|nr:Hypothetical predicted protein [Olea europaea subsp. europaea]